MFAGSATFVYYEANLEQLASLDWTYLNGGHGNVGSRDDIAFYRSSKADLKKAAGGALAAVKWGAGVDASKVNAHTAFCPPGSMPCPSTQPTRCARNTAAITDSRARFLAMQRWSRER